jgi:hypothetical protein
MRGIYEDECEYVRILMEINARLRIFMEIYAR